MRKKRWQISYNDAYIACDEHVYDTTKKMIMI